MIAGDAAALWLAMVAGARLLSNTQPLGARPLREKCRFTGLSQYNGHRFLFMPAPSPDAGSCSCILGHPRASLWKSRLKQHRLHSMTSHSSSGASLGGPERRASDVTFETDGGPEPPDKSCHRPERRASDVPSETLETDEGPELMLSMLPLEKTEPPDKSCHSGPT